VKPMPLSLKATPCPLATTGYNRVSSKQKSQLPLSIPPSVWCKVWLQSAAQIQDDVPSRPNPTLKQGALSNQRSLPASIRKQQLQASSAPSPLADESQWDTNRSKYRTGPTTSRRQRQAPKSDYLNLSARAYPQRIDNYFG